MHSLVSKFRMIKLFRFEFNFQLKVEHGYLDKK